MDNDDQVNFGSTSQFKDYPEEAIPLIIYNEEKRIFELNEEGRHYLSQITGQIGIIAVAGMYRTGKSYLLNRMLLDRSNGFGVGPTINPCTKGVWMWGKPVQGFTPEGDPISVIIMDTEGLGALDEDSNHDVRIFSLAVLLSSFFIYNSVGSIDENALQNLSLVINLTKHIQIKSSGISGDETDPEEYAKYFPSFMWVVRDFTLQLIDSEGENISPKEYLEKALQNQKGFSDSIEQKNRIRRMMKSFFTDRDCVTMIRPLTNEDKLQNLINIPMEELRPEFVDQVMVLRKKVLNRVKPKKINGKSLNGTMLWNLMESYVESINKGAIPSIESSWVYICKNECQKAQDESFDIFQKVFREEHDNGGPFHDYEIKEMYIQAKRQALDNFQKVAVGDVKAQYMEDLKEKIKQKYQQFKTDNDNTCEHECMMFLRQSYTEIERALKNQQYSSFLQYLEDIESFKQIFDESGPPGTNRKEILLEFIVKVISESSEFFLGHTANELNIQRTLAEENIRKLQQEIQEVKGEQKERMEVLESRLRKSDMEKAELNAKEQSTREQVQQLQSEKNELQNDFNTKVAQMKKDFEFQIEDTQNKASQADDLKKQIQREKVASESEFDKQKALLDQKVEFLEKALEDSSKREKEISTELKNCKKDFFNQNKEQNQQLEKQIKDQMKTIDELKEQIYEFENKNSELDFQMEDQKNSYNDQLTDAKRELAKAKENEYELNKKYENIKRKYEDDNQQLKTLQESEKQNNTEKINDLEQQLKDTQDTFELAKQSWAKQEAVLNQKLEFVEYQLNDEKKKFEENKQAHDSMLKSLNSSNRESVIGREEATQKINEMEQKFMNERKQQEEKYNEYRNRLTSELETLKNRNNELELSQKIQDGDYSKTMSQLKEQLMEAEQVKEEALKKLKNLDSSKSNSIQAIEDKYKQREAELDKLLDEKDQEIEELISDNNLKSEQKLNELKKLHDDEKERLEKRLDEQKQRQEKRLNQTIQDYEDKINDLTNNFEQDINLLEDEKRDNEIELNNQVIQQEKKIQVLQQQIESKESYLQELKDNFANLQNNTQKNLDAQAEKFSKERRELNNKIEQLTAEVSKRERAILSIENQRDSLQNSIKNKDKELDELKSDNTSEKSNLIQKIEDLKLKYDQTMDQLTQSKIESEREKALKDQRLSFQEQRIKEYNDQMNHTVERYEERLKQEKEDSQKALQERMARIQQEKENVETKYEQKRKALKELEKSVQQSQSQIEREKAVQNEKQENLQRQQKELLKNYEIENQKLQEQNEQLNQALSQGELGIRDQVEHWKNQYYDMERSHADLHSEFEKEKALWEGKFEFLDRQKEQAKKDNEDSLKQFQLTVDQLQKAQNENKSKNEHQYNVIISQNEIKFKKELKDLQENNSNQINQLQNTIRRLEKDNKSLNERIELSSKNSMSEQGGLEKKIERIQEERDRIKEDYEKVKEERDRKIDEIKKQFDREKEIIKQKNQELQQKCKNTEARQTELILSHETSKAKWEQEKSYLISAKDDAIQEGKSIQKKYEYQVKDIEKLKDQLKKNNWRNNKEKVGGTNNMMFKVGEGVIGRLNLGGAGAGLNRGTQGYNDLSQSTNNLNLGGNKDGGIGTYRSNLGVDKSVDNFKLGFGNQYGNQLGSSKFGSGIAGNMGGGGAVAQPHPSQSVNFQLGMGGLTGASKLGKGSAQKGELDNSMRGSNILSTPSSKGGNRNQDDEDVFDQEK